MQRWSPAGSPPTKQSHQQLIHLENVNPSQVCSIPVFWRLSHQALGIHPGQATRHTFSIRCHTGGEYAGLHTEMSGNQTQNLVTYPPRCKNWDKQENYTIWQRAKVFLSEIRMSSIQQFIVLLGSVPRGVTHLTANFHGRDVKNPPTASSDRGFPPQALWSSVPDVSSAIMVYWECLGDFLGCEIKCSALTTNMEEKPRQQAGGPVGRSKQ